MCIAWAKKNFRRRPDMVVHALLIEHSGSSACAKQRAFELNTL